ncbi:MAG: CsgG/HfaB family protein, partial [Fretibacterium sp.]|nr:CsgG/HfaB family protein [Fretibacterium sp.]
MRMRIRVWLASLAVLALLALPAWAQEGRVRIGVFQFESKASGVSQQQANAVMDLMTRALASSKSISVIEREQLDKVGREIRLGQSGLVDTSTAAELGRVAGVQYILLGAVTELSKKASGGAIPLFGEIGIAAGSEEARATIDVRLVDTSTAEVKLALSETGFSSNEMSGLYLGGAVLAEGTFDGLESRAIGDSVTRLAARIRSVLGGESSYVVAVRDKEATIDIGSSMGAREGALYLVYADGKSILGMNGEVIGRERLALAALKVREAAPAYSNCVFVKGSRTALVRRGDKVEPISAKALKSVKYADSRPSASSGTFEQIFGEGGQGGAAPATEDPLPETKPKASEPAAEKPTSTPAPATGETQKILGFDPNGSTDAKVIQTYALSAGDRNLLGIMQRNAYNKFRNGRYKDAYQEFSKAADAYGTVNYLSAYWAGVSAHKLKKKDDALRWIEKAL